MCQPTSPNPHPMTIISETFGVRATRHGDPRHLTYLTGAEEQEARALANRLWEGADIAAVEVTVETVRIIARKSR